MVGCRQKRQRAEHVPSQNSAVAKILVTGVVMGKLSPQFVQAVASAFIVDIGVHDSGFDVVNEVQKLASIGHGGTRSNFCRSQLFNSVLAFPLLVAQSVMMPFKDFNNLSSYTSELQDVFLPHEVFACLFKWYRPFWDTYIVPGPHAIRDFWTALRGHPLVQGNVVQTIEGFEHRVFPVWFHGDGVACVGLGKAWHKLFNCFSFGNMLKNGPSFTISFLSWLVFTASCTIQEDQHTMNFYWKLMHWSFYWLFEGLWPDRDWNGDMYSPTSAAGRRAGEPLFPCGGTNFLRGMLFRSKGDHDHHANTMHVNNISSDSPCVLCPCTTRLDDCPYQDFNPDRAQWIGRRFTNATWAAARPDQGIELYRLPFVSGLTTAYDNMHGKHLGSDRYLWGSLLWLLLYRVLDGSPANNCAYVWSLIQEEYGSRSYHRRRKARYTYFKLSLVCNPKTPYSSQPQLKGKASMIKHIGPILLDIWRQLMDDDDEVSFIISFIIYYMYTHATHLVSYVSYSGHMHHPPHAHLVIALYMFDLHTFIHTS